MYFNHHGLFLLLLILYILNTFRGTESLGKLRTSHTSTSLSFELKKGLYKGGTNITILSQNLDKKFFNINEPGINKVKNNITKKTTSEFTPNFNSSSDRKNHAAQKEINKTSVVRNNETSRSKNQKIDEDLSKEKELRIYTNTSHTLTSAHSQQHLELIFICCLIAILFLTVLISIVIYFSLRKKANILKRRTFKTSQKKVTFSRWKKKLNLEKPSIGDANSSFDLRLPRITIKRYIAPQILFKNMSSKIEYDLPLDEKWEFSKNVLTLGECLATSECSEVLKGKAFGISEKHTFTDVAVKKLKDNYSDKDIINLTLKMEAMKLMGSHENVLRLLGCCTQFGDLYLLTEYAPYGNLRDFLLQHRHPLTVAPPEVDLTENTLLSFAQQIAEGMKYLNSIEFIHRTLSARNILVFKGYTMKIGDFGLAKDITEHDFYEKSTMYKLPIKWMAPEVLFKKICTSKSDVWSYGVLLWEIFSFGEEPCTVFRNIEHFFSELRTGFRLEKPLYCSLKTYCLMHSCWNSVPEDRPTFIEILKSLEEILLASEIVANQ